MCGDTQWVARLAFDSAPEMGRGELVLPCSSGSSVSPELGEASVCSARAEVAADEGTLWAQTVEATTQEGPEIKPKQMSKNFH